MSITNSGEKEEESSLTPQGRMTAKILQFNPPERILERDRLTRGFSLAHEKK